MADNLIIDNNLSEEDKYASLLQQLEYLLDEYDPAISILANVSSAIKTTFNKISWAGFYIKSGNCLFLGPFQGTTACTKIFEGKGVCGTSVLKKETILVNDVNSFPGHIACDSGTKSEIVIPIFKGTEVIAVLDIDSYNYSAFNDTDKFYLEKLCRLIESKTDVSKIF